MLLSQKGWIRAVRGHGINPAEQKYKEGDGPRFAVPAETTDRLIVFGSNGRFYTIAADRLPGGRGQGEPLRLMIDLPNEHDVDLTVPVPAGHAAAGRQRATGAALSSTARRRWPRPAPASRC